MKRNIFFIIIFCQTLTLFNQVLASQESFQEIDEAPSLGVALKKIALGGTCIGVSNFTYDYTEEPSFVRQASSEIGLMAGTQLILGGTYDLLYWGFHKWQNHWYRSQNYKKMTRSERVSSEDIRPHKVREKDEFYWNKISNISRSIINTTLTAHFIYVSLKNKYESYIHGINPLSLRIENCDSERFFECSPLAMSAALSIGTFSLAYYLNETYHSLKQTRVRQGDRPIMGALAGWAEFIAGSQVFEYYPARLILTFLDPSTGNLHKVTVGSATGEYLHDLLVYHGEYQIFSNLLQMGRNGINIFKGTATIEIQKETGQIPFSSGRTGRNRIYSSDAASSSRSAQGIFSSSPSLPPTHEIAQISKEEESEQSSNISTPKVKIKKRGIPNQTPGTSTSTPSQSSSHISQNPPIRDEALIAINNLKKMNAVKKKHINKLLIDVCNFLKGKISSIDGSEYALVFYRGNQKISIKFEEPHGIDSAVYKGYKLKRVLNAIETAYMYDWDQQAIINYMENNQIRRFYTIPNNLLYILWTRPDLTTLYPE